MISKAQSNKIADIAQRYNLALLVLFGSQVTGQTHRQSDVDVGYLAKKELDYREVYDLSLSLAQVFKHPEVEVVNLNRVSPVLKKQVADQGLVLFERGSGLFDLFAIQANRSYLETKPLRLYRNKYIENFLKTYAQ